MFRKRHKKRAEVFQYPRNVAMYSAKFTSGQPTFIRICQTLGIERELKHTLCPRGICTPVRDTYLTASENDRMSDMLQGAKGRDPSPNLWSRKGFPEKSTPELSLKMNRSDLCEKG